MAVQGSDVGRTSQVTDQLHWLSQNVGALGDFMSELEKRLSSVLRDEEPLKEGGNDPEPHLVLFADNIRVQARTVEYIHSRGVSVLERLEL